MPARSAEDLVAADRVGSTIADRFELIAFAAAGGMGQVYRARDVKTGATVAVKLLTKGSTQRFEREASLLAKMDHAGVVKYVDHGSTRDADFIAMEWLDGEDLAERLGMEGTLSIDETLTVAEKSAEALAVAHHAGIVHRDLKPANMFLVDGRFERLTLIDFGVALDEDDVDITATGAVIGTPSYMAPEQVRGEDVGAGADVYGLGAVMFRCLTGTPPFRGSHQLAVLAKVVIEPPPSVRAKRPDVPTSLEALITRLLSKDPSDRPVDGASLLAELRELRESELRTEKRQRSVISAREQRVACVVLCASIASPNDVTLVEASAADAVDSLKAAVHARGGSLDALAKGAWLVTIPGAASSAEQATRAAQCALAVAAARPATPLFVATGRVLMTGGAGHVGEVIDRAAAALVEARIAKEPGGVRVDAATAEMLGAQFRIEGDGEWRTLVRQEDAVAPVRTLLGKPARLVGRDAQLATLEAAALACADESRAAAVLVVSPPALGKTHLVHELLRTSRAIRSPDDVLFANGDPIRASSAFGIAAQIISRAAGMRDSESAADRSAKLRALVDADVDAGEAPRVREFFGEICGISTPDAAASPALRAARADASVMSDALREAWTNWMATRASRGTAIVILEDAHWADAASLNLIETSLARLADRPLLLLATSRPEASAAIADRFRKHGLVELTLGPLSTNAAEKLVKSALGPSVDPEIVRALVRRSAGHPFHLEELVRAVASGLGPDALPDSVLGMVQARLDEISAGARRMLRAASVFGETFTASGVSAIMGDDATDHDLRRAFAELASKELIVEERGLKWREGAGYKFRHALFRDAAYETLADADRARAHKRAAVWLEESGEPDAAVLGEHFDRGRSPQRAAQFFQRAAALALQHNDFERANAHAARALALGPDAPTEAALRAIEAEILYWRGDLTTAAERAPSAIARLPRGVPAWFEAVSIACGALGQLGRNDEVATILRDAARIDSTNESRGAQVVALCRGMTQLFWAHAGAGLADVRASLDALVVDPKSLNAYQLGWVHRVRGESAWLHARNMGTCLAELDASCDAFADARATRQLCVSRLNAASLTGWSGNPARGLELVASARADAERLGAGFLLSYAHAVEGLLLAYAGDRGAEDAMRRALAEVTGSPRLEFVCRVVLAESALNRGDVPATEIESTALSKLRVVDDLRACGLAISARVALAKGDHADALRIANDAVVIARERSDLELTHGIVGLTFAEALAANGDRAGAKDAIFSLSNAIASIAKTIESADQRRRFTERPLMNDRIARLARDLDTPET